MPQFKESTKIEQAIEKFGGKDEKYKLELKRQVRDYLGYSNWVGQMNQVGGSPLSSDIPMKGLTPAGVKSVVGSAIGLKNQEMGYLQTLAKGADIAGGGIAASRAAAKKGAGGKTSNLADFEIRDWLDSEIQHYIKNPVDEKGNTIPVEELRRRLKEQWIGEGGLSPYVKSEADIDARIAQIIPEDFDKNWEDYSYSAMGYTDSQIQDLKSYRKFSRGEMGEYEKKIFEVKDTALANKAKYFKEYGELFEDIIPKRDPETGQITLAGVEQIREKYKNIPEAEFKEIVQPSYKVVLEDDFRQMLEGNEELAREVQSVIDPNVPPEEKRSVKSLMEEDLLKDFFYALKLDYQGVFNATEIEKTFYDYIYSR
jgi:hypothetical protein